MRSTGSPISRAASSLPPSARTCRPKRVKLSSVSAPSRKARTMIIAGTGSPGIALARARSGRWFTAATPTDVLLPKIRASPRAASSIASVTMKGRMPEPRDDHAADQPQQQCPPAPRPARPATSPFGLSSAATTLASAATAPTERSMPAGHDHKGHAQRDQAEHRIVAQHVGDIVGARESCRSATCRTGPAASECDEHPLALQQAARPAPCRGGWAIVGSAVAH